MKGKFGKGWRFGTSVGLLCLVILFFLWWLRQQRDVPAKAEGGPRRREQAAGTSSTRHRVRPGIPSREGAPDKVGIIVPASEAWKWQPAFSKALKWMEERGLPCVLVSPPELDRKVLEDICSREGVEAEIWPLNKAVAELGTLLLAPAPKPDSEIVASLKSYVSTGGWLVVPEGGSLISSLLEIPEYRAQKLNSLRSSYEAPGPGIPSEARCVVAHPVVNGFPCGGWLSAKTLAGSVPPLLRKGTVGIPLMLFRNPAGVGVQVFPVGYGGIVEVSWDVYAGGQLGSTDANQALQNVLQWLLGRANWKKPLEEPVLSVEGKVVATDGNPVPKASIAGKVFTDWGEPVTEVTTVSAENGSFTLPGYAPSIYDFEVSAEGYLQEDRFVMARCEVGREDEPTIIRMRRTGALYGTVHYREETGALAPNFPVRLLPADRDVHSQTRETTTDNKGEFIFKRVEHGRTVLLIAEKDDWVGMKVVELPLGQDEEPERIKLAVLQVPEVRGNVIDGDSETPLPQAKVRVEPYYPEPKLRVFEKRLTRKVDTDDRANFALRLPAGRWRLEPDLEGYITWYRESESDTGTRYELGRADITVSETSPKEEIVLKLERFPLVRFYGTVYFPSGEPAPGARVVVYASPAPSQGVYIADPMGRYTTDPIPRLPGFDGENQEQKGKKLFTFWFGVRCGEFAISELVELEVIDKEVKHDFWLGEGISISGFVRDPHGNPVEGARVYPVKLYTAAKEGQETYSAADGSFTLLGVPRTMWNSTLRAEKMVKTGSGTVLYAGEVTPAIRFRDKPVEGVEIIIARAGGLSGRVLYHDGTPVRNAQVEFKLSYSTGKFWKEPEYRADRWVILDDDGQFQIELPCVQQRQNLIWRDIGRDRWREPEEIPADAGTWNIVVRKEGGFGNGVLTADSVVVLMSVDAGTSDLEVRLPRLATITARVLDAYSHEPIESLNVDLWAEDDAIPRHPGLLGLRGTTENFADGNVRIEEIVPGKHHFSVKSDGYRSRAITDINVLPGQRIALGEIALEQSWTIMGTVTAQETGQPIRAKVEAGPLTSKTWEDGTVWLDLSPMTGLDIRIIPEDDRWEPATLRVTYDGNPTTHLGDILLRPREGPKEE